MSGSQELPASSSTVMSSSGFTVGSSSDWMLQSPSSALISYAASSSLCHATQRVILSVLEQPADGGQCTQPVYLLGITPVCKLPLTEEAPSPKHPYRAALCGLSALRDREMLKLSLYNLHEICHIPIIILALHSLSLARETTNLSTSWDEDGEGGTLRSAIHERTGDFSGLNSRVRQLACPLLSTDPLVEQYYSSLFV